MRLEKDFPHFRLRVEAAWRGPALFLGPNGSGKSTALKCMAGLYPCRREVLLDGRPAPPQAFLYVPPNPRLPNVTVAEFLRHASRLLGRPVEPLLGVDRYMAMRGSQLSSGMAARVLLAVALSAGRVPLLDEPLSYLEAEARVELARALRGRPFVAATHDPGPLLPLGPAAVLFSGGKATVVDSRSLKAIYLEPCGDGLCARTGPLHSTAGYVA